jgi:hypothetical protein
MSTRAKKVKTPKSSPSGTPWKGTIPTDVFNKVKEIAEEEERSFSITLVRLLREALAAHGKHDPLPAPITRSYDIRGGSEPPARIAAMAKGRAVHGKTPIDPAMEEIVNSEEGWEGSDPAALFKDTKVPK